MTGEEIEAVVDGCAAAAVTLAVSTCVFTLLMLVIYFSGAGGVAVLKWALTRVAKAASRMR